MLPLIWPDTAQVAGLRFWLAGVRVQVLLRKANFNPAQLRIPAGQPGAGRWADDGVEGFTPVADKEPPLRRLHPDSTYERDQIAKGALEYWRRQPTDKIIESLKEGAKQPLIVKPDGTISQGNTRVKVLEERGYDISILPRVPYDDAPRHKPGGGRPGGSIKPPGRRPPKM